MERTPEQLFQLGNLAILRSPMPKRLNFTENGEPRSLGNMSAPVVAEVAASVPLSKIASGPTSKPAVPVFTMKPPVHRRPIVPMSVEARTPSSLRADVPVSGEVGASSSLGANVAMSAEVRTPSSHGAIISKRADAHVPAGLKENVSKSADVHVPSSIRTNTAYISKLQPAAKHLGPPVATASKHFVSSTTIAPLAHKETRESDSMVGIHDFRMEDFVLLEEWFVIPIVTDTRMDLIIAGRRVDIAEMWCSSVIVERIKSSFLMAQSGTGYRLGRVSNLSTFDVLSRDFLSVFKEGFPVDWKEHVHREFGRITGTGDRHSLESDGLTPSKSDANGLHDKSDSIRQTSAKAASGSGSSPTTPMRLSLKRPAADSPPTDKSPQSDSVTKSGRKVISPRAYWTNHHARLADSPSPFPKRRWGTS